MTPDPLAALLHELGDQHGPPRVGYDTCPFRAEHDSFASDLRERGVTVGDGLREALNAAERMYLAVGAITAGDKSVSEEYLLAYTELGDALKAARAALATPPPPRIDPERLAHYVAAVRYVLQLATQPGFDDDEWEYAVTDLEAEHAAILAALAADEGSATAAPALLREALSRVDTGSAEGRAFLEGYGLARQALAPDDAAIAREYAALDRKPWREASRRLIANGDDDEGSAA